MTDWLNYHGDGTTIPIRYRGQALQQFLPRIAALEAEIAELRQFEDAVRHACFDHSSVDMSGKVRWARAVPVSSVMRHIFDAYGSEPLTPDGTIPSPDAKEATE